MSDPSSLPAVVISPDPAAGATPASGAYMAMSPMSQNVRTADKALEALLRSGQAMNDGSRFQMKTLLKAYPRLLINMPYEDMEKLCNALDIEVIGNKHTREAISAMESDIRAKLDLPSEDVRDPAWSGSTEAIGDLTTAYGNVITLISILVSGTKAGNATNVINLAIGALSVWCLMFFMYWTAKSESFVLGFLIKCLPKGPGWTKPAIRNGLLQITSLLGVAYFLLSGAINLVGFQITKAGSSTSDSVFSSTGASGP